MGPQTIDAIKGFARLGEVEEKKLSKSCTCSLVFFVIILILTWTTSAKKEELEKLASVGYKDIVLVPIAFTSDHIETLFELDLEYVKEGHEVRTQFHILLSKFYSFPFIPFSKPP
jgi:protoheme ferro-lyase